MSKPNIAGKLTEQSEMRRVFPDGFVPLKSLTSTRVRLGTAENNEESDVFFMDTSQVTDEQLSLMANDMAARGLSKYNEALEALKSGVDLPVRAHHFVSVSVPLRYIL